MAKRKHPPSPKQAFLNEASKPTKFDRRCRATKMAEARIRWDMQKAEARRG